MALSTSARVFPETPRRWRALLAAIAAGPVAWAMQLEANYVMSYVACEQRHTWMLHLCGALALAIATWGAVVSRRAGSDALAAAGPGDSDDNVGRFMASAGFVVCIFFLLVIVATEIPVLLVPPCTP
jgi:hypothetical protein